MGDGAGGVTQDKVDLSGSVQWELDLSHGRNAATVQDSESISLYPEGDTDTLLLPFFPLQSPANASH